MRTIDEFVKHIKNGENSFIITENKIGRKLLCTCATIGKAQFVFTDYTYGDITEIEKMELCAIISDGQIYIVNGYNFGFYRHTEALPEGVVMFADAVWDYNLKAESYFQDFYDSLPVAEISESYIKCCKGYARTFILNGKGQPVLKNSKDISKLYDEDIKRLLTGVIDFKDLVLMKFENAKEYWINKKTDRIACETAMKDPDIVKPYELEIAVAINGIEAKAVKIEFEMNGETAAGKIEPFQLMMILIRNDCFSRYNFCTTKEGDAIIKKLGASTLRRDGDDKTLTCKHITKIMYGKKELYVRNEKIVT